MKKRRLLLLCSIIALLAFALMQDNRMTKAISAATNVSISKQSAELYVGDKLTLRILGKKSSVKWSTLNKKIAAVDSKGNVSAQSVGETTIMATVDKTTLKCKVTVTNPIIIIDPMDSSTFNQGKFEGWGTSLAWWGNRIGYSDKMSKKAAELLYGEKNGLGLNIVRYNIGGGDDPTHNHITRTDSAVPGYLYWDSKTKKYEYDWSADYNQRNALSKIVDVSGKNLIVEGFANSAPYFMTISGCTSGAVDGKNNLKEDYFDDFANYLADVTLHFKNNLGVTFSSISAMNEPLSGWTALSPKQEGGHFDAGDTQSKMIEELENAFSKKGLKNVLITASDAQGTLETITAFESLSKKAKNIVDRIDTHTYSGTYLSSEKLRKLAKDNKKNLWMSETDGGATVGDNSGQMGAALWLGQKIISDMNGLKPSAWVMWQAIANFYSTEGYNGNKDASKMVDVNGGYWGCAVADIDKEEIVLTQKYYAYGQFTKYIRPGYTIIGSSPIANNYYSLAAYDKTSKRLVIVAINIKNYDRKYEINLEKFKSIGSKVKVIRTSGSLERGESWDKLKDIKTNGKGFTADMKAYSITTFILDDVILK
ncbi:MAG: glycoside hydrolase [Mobilitalea sp.]